GIAQGLSDSNTFRNIEAQNATYGIYLYGTQSFINHIYNPTIAQTTIAIANPFSHQTEVIGGNLSATSSNSAALAISVISALFQGGGCTVSYCFNATLPTGQTSINTVWNSFSI